MVNILLYHLLMNTALPCGMGAFAILCGCLSGWEHRLVFEKLFAAHLEE